MTLAPLLYKLDLLIQLYPFAFFLLDTFIKTSLIILLAIAVNYSCRKQSASNASLVWLVAITTAFSVPLISLVIPQLTIGITLPDYEPVGTYEPTAIFQLVSWFTLVYLTGLILMAGYLIAGLLRLVLISNNAQHVESGPITDMLDQLRVINGESASIKLLKSPVINTPLTWGFVRHKLLIPEAALDWDEDLLRQALSHELGHIQRNDWCYHLLTKIALCIYWPNPLAWYAAGKLKVESEKACDDAAIDCSGSRFIYATNLLGLATSIRNYSPSTALGMFSRPSILTTRIHHILAGDKKRSFLRSDEILVTVLFSLILITPFSVLRFSLNSLDPVQTASLDIAEDAPVSRTESTLPVVPQHPVSKPRQFASTNTQSPHQFSRSYRRIYELNGIPGYFKPENVSHNFSIADRSLYRNWESTPLHLPRPTYPIRALTRRIEGHVVAEYKINNKGEVFDTRIIESVPTGVFEKSVLDAVNSYVYCSEIVKGIGGNSRPIRQRFLFSLADSI